MREPSPLVPKRSRRSARVLLALTVIVLGVLLKVTLDGARAYVFGYPLVIMDVTRAAAALTVGPTNGLLRVRAFPDARFRGVVRPNVDTLYTTAFIDMNDGPFVFEMAPNAVRYELFPFMDAWTNVFASPGTRTAGTAGGRYLLVGPAWQGTPPDGLAVLRAPTRIVWLIGRTQTNGAADYPLVHRLQDAVTLRPLAPRVTPAWRPASQRPAPPVEQVRAMSTEAFFTRLAALMVDNPPTPADAPMMRRLAALGVAPGRPLRWNALDRWSASIGRWVADRAIARRLQNPPNLVRGWSTPPSILGRYGTNYAVRGAVAMAGLGANLPVDAMYPNARVDARGDALDGSHRYRIHFAAGALPPVNAFWSVTAYGADEALLDTGTGRFAVGDRDALRPNPDGSLDLWVQATPPRGEARANWLPVRAGAPFLLNARLYWPRPEALRGTWSMPAVERLD
ncbi:MAG: DUF1254 domain-containing protein [Myxococcaceae bacterium]|nr:MAG: DUF1254 domain-containing protein [Myxococcaceae bacterium]